MAAITTSGGGRSWQRIVDPGTGVLTSKTSGWTNDSFSGGLEVDFSPVVPVGTVAAYCSVNLSGTGTIWYYRPYNDSNISNTPDANSEYAMIIAYTNDNSGYTRIQRLPLIFFLSSDYKIQITGNNNVTACNVYYPSAVLL